MNLISYSFTFTIPAFKKVYWNGKRRAYGSLSPSQQFHFLEDIMTKIINPLYYKFIDWIYEKHEDGRLHIHGFVKCDEEHDDKIFLLRDTFYSYNEKINIKMSSYLKISDIQRTYADINYWLEYMNKNQNDIIFKNGYTQQQELISALDAGIVKINHNKRYKRPEGYWLKYRFGENHPDEYETDNSFEVEI